MPNRSYQINWDGFINDSGEEIPAFAAMKITGEQDGYYLVEKPDTDNQVSGIMFNGPTKVDIGDSGSGTFDFPCAAAFDDAATPANGDEIGVDAGEWYLDTTHTGFFVLSAGTIVTGQKGYVSVVPVPTSTNATPDFHYWISKEYAGSHSTFVNPCDLAIGQHYDVIQPYEFTDSATGDTGIIVATPFIAPHGGTLKTLGLFVPSPPTASANVRIGIYARDTSTHPNYLYPGALLVDSGDVDVSSAGYKIATGLTVTLEANEVYFAAIRLDNDVTKIPGLFGHRYQFLSATNHSFAGLVTTKASFFENTTLPGTAKVNPLGGSVFLPLGFYNFTMDAFLFANTGADGIAMDFDGGTGTTTDFIAHVQIIDNSGIVTSSFATSEATNITAATVISSNILIRATGTFEITSAGTFRPRFAKNSDTGSDANLFQGSRLIVYDGQQPSLSSWQIKGYSVSQEPTPRYAVMGWIAHTLGALAALPDPFPTTNIEKAVPHYTPIPRLFYELESGNL